MSIDLLFMILQNHYIPVEIILSFFREMTSLGMPDPGTWLHFFFSLIPQAVIGVGTDLLGSMFLIAKLEESLARGLRIISLFAFIIATIVIMYGGYQIRTGNPDAGKMSILGGLVIGLAIVIVTSIFEIADLPVLKVAK